MVLKAVFFVGSQAALSRHDMVLEVRVMLVALYAAIDWATETAIFSGTLFISLVVAGRRFGIESIRIIRQTVLCTPFIFLT